MPIAFSIVRIPVASTPVAGAARVVSVLMTASLPVSADATMAGSETSPKVTVRPRSGVKGSLL
jgi:hypothetical protein